MCRKIVVDKCNNDLESQKDPGDIFPCRTGLWSHPTRDGVPTSIHLSRCSLAEVQHALLMRVVHLERST